MLRPLRRLVKTLRYPLDRREARRVVSSLHRPGAGLEDWIDRVLDFGGPESHRVRTIQLRSEIRGLCERVAALQPRRVVEIGTARGGTLLLWSQIATELVVSCDLKCRRFLRHLAPAFPPSGGCRVELLEGDSHAPAFRERLWQRVGEGGADFLFIDGDHTEAGVEQDYRDYRGLVRPGGLIAFHDIVEAQPLETNQVGRFWRRLRAVGEVEELVDDPGQCGYGIGVLRVPAAGAPLPPP